MTEQPAAPKNTYVMDSGIHGERIPLAFQWPSIAENSHPVRLQSLKLFLWHKE